MRSLKPLAGSVVLMVILGAPVAFAQFAINTVAGGGPNHLPALSSSIGYAASVARDALGNTYIADSYSSQVFEVSVAGTLTTVAGNGTLGYSGDGGPAISAALNRPESVAMDAAGNLYIADTDNSVIRVVNLGSQSVTIAGVAIAPGNIATIAGNGTAGYGGDGASAAGAQLNDPFGVFVDSQANIFIADTDNSVIREVVASSGNIQTVAGTPSTTGYSGDGGPATSAALDLPQSVFVDTAGIIYIADTFNSVIRAVNPGAQPATIASIVIPAGDIATVAGTFYSSVGACQHTGDGGAAISAFLCQPAGVFVDGSGNIFIADTANYGIREVVPAGTISTIAGTLGTGGYSGDGAAATSATLNYPTGVFVDGSGNLFIADIDNFVIREVAGGNIQTIVGNATLAYSGDGGPATGAALNIPGAVFVDGSGNLFIADTYNSVIRKVVAGNVQTVAGNGKAGYTGDGAAATSAELNYPYGVFVDGSGNIFIADTENSAVREVVAATGFIQTIAGTGTAGYSGDGGAATSATLSSPYGVAVDGGGNIYIADTDNSAIRVINPGAAPVTVATVTIQPGAIQTIAGNGTPCSDPSSGCGDNGPATSAQLNFPSGISLDSQGNIFIADTFDNVVREVNASTGTIQTIAGALGTRGYAGDNAAATSAALNTPYGIFVDSLGNLFIADTENDAIREVVAVNNSTIQTIAGTGTAGFSGDGGSSASAMLASPLALAGGANGTLFIADSENSRVRELVSTLSVSIVPAPVTVPAGDTQQFAAIVTGSNNTSVTWQVNNISGGNSTVGTISSAGLYQAPASVPAPAVTVTAISNANGVASGFAAVTIAGSGTPAISITSSPSGVTNVYTNATQTFNATVVGESNTAVNWQVNSVAGGNATVGTISNSGVYTAPAAVPSPALVLITAVSQADATVSASYPVTIVTAPSASQPSPQTISPGSNATYSLSLKANTGNPKQPITLSCQQSSLPPGATCTFSPAIITPSSAPVPFTLTIAVPAGAASLQSPVRIWAGSAMFFAFMPLAGIFLIGGARPSTRKGLWLVALLIVLIALNACGGNGSGSNAGGGSASNAELGTYQIAVLGTTAAQPTPTPITSVGLTVK